MGDTSKDRQLPEGEFGDAALPPLIPLGESVWAIRPDVLPRLIEAHRTAGSSVAGSLARSAAVLAARIPEAGALARRAGAGASQVAVVPLQGVLTPRPSLLSLLFGGGGGGLAEFRSSFIQAINDPEVQSVVIDVDSPGGVISLIPETAQLVREARGEKPIVAVANTMAASAAYWIAAQADEVVVTPSGEAGSVGVYMVHEDWSGFNAQMGVVPTYIKAGRYKAEGNPDAPLSESAQAAWQADVDARYAMFLEDVAQGRGITAKAVQEGYGEGRSLIAADALAAGVVDRVESLPGVLGGLLGADAGTGTAGALGTRQAAGRAALALAEASSDDDEDPPAEDEDEAEPEDKQTDDEAEAEQARTREDRARIAAMMLDR